MIEYVLENKEWIFSGIGVALLSWLIFRNSSGSSMRQKGGDNSTNVQIGGDFKVNSKESNDDGK